MVASARGPSAAPTAGRARAAGVPFLDLRDGLTGLIVESLRDEGARLALEALEAHAASADRGDEAPAVRGTAARRLLTARLLDRDGRLPRAYRPWLVYLRDRCARAAEARRLVVEPPAGGPAGLAPELSAYAALMGAGLYFEAHEQLEAAFHRSRGRGDDRLFYQGLVQLAVAFQHLANGNRAGAASLLGASLEKLSALGPGRLGLDLERLCLGIRRAQAAVLGGAPFDPALVPPLAAARDA